MLASDLLDDMALKAIPLKEDLLKDLMELRQFIHMKRDEVGDVWMMDERLKSHLKSTTFPMASWTSDFGEVWALGLSLAWYLIPRGIRVNVNGLFRWLGLSGKFSSQALSESFKALTKLAKKAKDELWGYWMFLVDWQNLGGVHGEVLSEKVLEKWKDEVRHSLEPIIRSDDWVFHFSSGVDRVLNEWEWKIRWERIFAPEEFVRRPAIWATSGSTVNPNRLGYVGKGSGKVRRAAATKWNMALGSSPDTILECMLHPMSDQYTAVPFPKVETVFRPVPRVVTNASESLYLNMSCIYQVIEQAYHGCELGYGWRGDNLSSIRDYMFFAKLNSMDQSGFDHHVSRVEIFVMLERLERQFEKRWPPGMDRWYEGCFSRIRDLIDNCLVVVGGEKLKWMNGILSGWKFTSMLDTLANIAQAYAVAEMYDLPMPVCTGMGDDYIEKVDSEGTAICRLEGMTVNGFELKPGDTTIGDLGEFIRYVIGRGEAKGYPIRAVASYVWKAEVTGYATIGLGNLDEALTQYLTSVGRGLDEVSARKIANGSLARIWGGTNQREVFEWAKSPASMGGGGMWEWREGDEAMIGWERVADERIFKDDIDIKWHPWWVEDMGRRGVGSRDAEKYLSSLATIRGRKSFVKKGTLKRSRRAVWSGFRGGVSARASLPTAAVWKYEYSTLIGWDQTVVAKCRDHDYEYFVDKFDETTASGLCFSVLRKNAGRRVVDMWLQGRLPFSPPKISRYNSSVIHEAHRFRVNWAWDKCTSSAHIRMSTIENYALCAEALTYQDMKMTPEAFTAWSP